MWWLKPESALWDAIAERMLKPKFTKSQKILEVGIGNGYFSFLLFGGEFQESFDWFFNIEYEDYWREKDVFDSEKFLDIKKFIKKTPEKKINLAVDHKKNLIRHAEQLDFVDKFIVQDANLPIETIEKFDTIYSNILYWLNDPMEVIRRLVDHLDENGRLILVFPNDSFYEYCHSYLQSNQLLKLLNRGRASHIMWSMDLESFKKRIDAFNSIEIVESSKYLSKNVLKIWDVGLRPLMVPLTKMANNLNPVLRAEIKQEWCETVKKFSSPLLEYELDNGNKNGGFNLVVLAKKS